jgi:hypothetical protein
MAARLNFGERGVVGVVIGDRDLNVVGLLEFLDQLRARVLTQIVDVELTVFPGSGGKSHHGECGGSSHETMFHCIPPVMSKECYFFFDLLERRTNPGQIEFLGPT